MIQVFLYRGSPSLFIRKKQLQEKIFKTFLWRNIFMNYNRTNLRDGHARACVPNSWLYHIYVDIQEATTSKLPRYPNHLWNKEFVALARAILHLPTLPCHSALYLSSHHVPVWRFTIGEHLPQRDSIAPDVAGMGECAIVDRLGRVPGREGEKRNHYMKMNRHKIWESGEYEEITKHEKFERTRIN